MARFTLSRGACPVCDRDVTRVVHAVRGMLREVFQCPAHGRLEYGPGSVPLEAMGHGSPGLPELHRAQPLTGLEMVH